MKTPHPHGTSLVFALATASLVVSVLGCMGARQPHPRDRATTESVDTTATPRDPGLAAQLNTQGKEQWLKQGDLEGAARSFRQAVEYDPEVGEYWFNACYAEHQLGRMESARQACEQALANTDDERLAQKARVVIDDIDTRLGSTQ